MGGRGNDRTMEKHSNETLLPPSPPTKRSPYGKLLLKLSAVAHTPPYIGPLLCHCLLCGVSVSRAPGERVDEAPTE